MVWCFDPLGTVQEPRDLSTGGSRGRPRTWEGIVGFLLNKEANFNDSMILMVCFRDLYIFFQQKNTSRKMCFIKFIHIH